MKVIGKYRLFYKNARIEETKNNDGTISLNYVFETTKLFDLYVEVKRLCYEFIEMFK